ncbi:UNVERIFIED_CONTAM: hypothetical protein GTU68_014899 [Idotea baltica]|nr:hypothetical protein [Idotea baltica]
MGKASQAKLVRVTKGEVLDVVVDTRKGSETFGKHFKMKLSSDNHKAIFIPKGMAHGFLTLSEEAIFNYKCDNYYYPNTESGIIYNDENLDIDWESQDDDLIISKKDLKLPKFSDL